MPPVDQLPPDAQDEYIMEGVNAKEETKPPPLRQEKSVPRHDKKRQSSSPSPPTPTYSWLTGTPLSSKPASQKTRGSTDYPALDTFATLCQIVAVLNLIAGGFAILVGLVILIGEAAPSAPNGWVTILSGGALLFQYYVFRAIADLVQLLLNAAGDLQALREQQKTQKE